jgi:hypothetical protein
MTDYTKIEAWRLADDLTVSVYERTRSFPREVEKEAGKFGKIIATATSLFVIGVIRWSGGQLSMVS